MEELRPIETAGMAEPELTAQIEARVSACQAMLFSQMESGTPFLTARDLAEAELRCEPEATPWEQEGATAALEAMTELYLRQ
jgi:hypothetical protein